MIREINSRTNAGTTVTLSVSFEREISTNTDKPVFGIVSVSSDFDSFTINEIPLDQCVNVYHHPFAVANRYLESGRLDRWAA